MMNLLGPFGPVRMRVSVRDGIKFMHCARLGCCWFMDWTCLPLDMAQEEAVMHECHGVWRGYERYTIAPERPKGRRL